MSTRPQVGIGARPSWKSRLRNVWEGSRFWGSSYYGSCCSGTNDAPSQDQLRMLFEEVGVVKALFGSTLSFMPRWKGGIRGIRLEAPPKELQCLLGLLGVASPISRKASTFRGQAEACPHCLMPGVPFGKDFNKPSATHDITTLLCLALRSEKHSLLQRLGTCGNSVACPCSADTEMLVHRTQLFCSLRRRLPWESSGAQPHEKERGRIRGVLP